MEETQVIEAPVHYSPNQLVTYKVIDGSNVTYNTDKVTTIEYELDGARKTLDKLKALQSKVNHIVDMLQADGWYDSSVTKEDVLNDLCETLGHNPVKTIDFSATLSVTPPTTTIPISDGLYNFTYKVYIHGKDVDYYITKSKIILISCGVECATKKLMAGLSVCDCKCWDDKTYETAILAWTMLQSLLAARNCGTNQNTINKILTNLQNLLAISKSKCGCLDGSKGLNASAL